MDEAPRCRWMGWNESPDGKNFAAKNLADKPFIRSKMTGGTPEVRSDKDILKIS